MISLNNVSLIHKKRRILEDVSLTAFQGDFFYITGVSGAGKTSILKLFYMDMMPTAGEVIVSEYSSRTIKNRKIPFLRRSMGIIFQDFRLLKDRNIHDNLAFVLEVTGEDPNVIPKKIEDALKDVELGHKQFEMPNSLSGGEQQRVAIARAIVRNPKIILADEPTANLDEENSREVISLLHKLNNSNNITTIVVTHNHSIISEFPATTYLLENKKLVEVEIDYDPG